MSKEQHPLREWRHSQPSSKDPERKMSQEELGEMIGVRAAQISLVENWERGCSFAVAKKIVDLTDGAVSLETLMAREAAA